MLVEQATELSGAERVPLVPKATAARFAGADLPAARIGDALAAITPWLAEAARACRARATVRTAQPPDQRSHRRWSCSTRLLGLLALTSRACTVAESVNRDLLATLASQSAVALANLRTTGRAGAHGSPSAPRRPSSSASELAVVNAIQQAMASELDFQAIVDVVGDKLRAGVRRAGIYTSPCSTPTARRCARTTASSTACA